MFVFVIVQQKVQLQQLQLQVLAVVVINFVKWRALNDFYNDSFLMFIISVSSSAIDFNLVLFQFAVFFASVI